MMTFHGQRLPKIFKWLLSVTSKDPANSGTLWLLVGKNEIYLVLSKFPRGYTLCAIFMSVSVFIRWTGENPNGTNEKWRSLCVWGLCVCVFGGRERSLTLGKIEKKL